ncbi:uncharacterized protein LOC124675184 [Lolium rigidum]|uniref:uncharacterized protein LOC124675184 n=1 Tax=Lolium rigidum TaxID=89674 RepID=UPI001F5D4DA4|nr:uncharacterized protein LOC124675184 [Lolium rigidum]
MCLCVSFRCLSYSLHDLGCFSQRGPSGLHYPNGIMAGSKNEPAEDGLPDGWSKEYRPRKVRAGARARRDMFYIDPTNSYEFRSLKDVYRHLESQDASNSAETPNKRKVEDLQISENRSHHAEGTSDNIQMDSARESNPKSRENSGNMPLSEHEGVSLGRLTELELQKASVNNQSLKHESTGREKANVGPKSKGKKQRTKPAKQVSTPLRASPRLTALKVNQELKHNQEASNVLRDSPVSTQTDIADQLKPTKLVKNPKSKTIPSLPPWKKDGAHIASASEHPGDKYPSAHEQIPGTSVACSITDVRYQNAPSELHVPPRQTGLFETADDMPGSSLSSLLRGILSDPCLEFAFKTLTGDIPVPDNNLADANYFIPPPDLTRGDPCLEFAFKTLTGEIPVLDNNLAVANYLIPPQNLNKGAASNCSSSTYDGKNHAQVDHVRLPMPRQSDNLYSSGWFPPQ